MGATQKEIMAKVTNTVGYNETTNKPQFLSGADVAIAKAIEFYDPKIKALTESAEYWKGQYESTKNDFFTLAKILNKYSPE